MTINHKPENTTKTNEAHPSLGKALHPLDNEKAMKRLNHKGYWAAERKGRIRVVEFHQQPNGDSNSTTFWFDTPIEALAHYGMETTEQTECGCCGEHDSLNKVINPLGQWVCMKCESEMNETMNDLFFYSQGRWTL